MFLLLMIWLALLAALVVFAVGRAGQGGTLTLAYFLGLSLIHVPGVLPFLLPGAYLPGLEETEVGFRLTLLGMALFVCGAVAAKLVLKQRALRVASEPMTFEKLGWKVLLFGLFSYFILLPLSGRFASLTAVISPLGTLLIVGIWMRLYGASMRRDSFKTWQTLALLPLLPLSTLSTAGFIGYGIYWLISVISFLFTIERRRMLFYALTPVVVIFGLSFFIAYMGERTAIRDLVYKENAGVVDRLNRIGGIFTNFHPLDLNNPRDSGALQERLNQNYFVGVGAERLDQGLVSLYYGATVPVWVLVPRAIWADKPSIGGGGDLVSDFTGIKFSENTSVGSGQVLEFFMNFGAWGIMVGFAGLGFLLMWIDRGIIRAFQEMNVGNLLKYAMPGLALMQPGGNLSEIIITAIAATAVAYAIGRTKIFQPPTRRRRQFAPMQSAPRQSGPMQSAPRPTPPILEN